MWRSITRAILALVLLVATPRLALAEIDPSRLSLPKGPGSIEGLGTLDLAPQLASGQASFSIPIEVPPGARSLGPSLALSYDSGIGTSEIAVGWRLSGVPSVRRRTQDGLPRFDDTDTFEVSGLGSSAELLEVRPGVWRPRYEDGSFIVARFDGEIWEVRTKAGLVYTLGAQWLGEDGQVPAVFLLEHVRDLWGHEVQFDWRTDGGYALLERVVWNDIGPEHRNEVRFDYEPRPDRMRLYAAGIRQELSERLRLVTVTHGGRLVRRYELAYGHGAHPNLESVVLLGADGTSRMPATRFRYSDGEPDLRKNATLVEMSAPPGRSPGDADVTLADLNGDSLPDLLIGHAGEYASTLNVDGTTWDAGRSWGQEQSPSFSLAAQGVRMADFDGDGALDLLSSSPSAPLRYLAHATDSGFAAEIAVAGEVALDLDDPNVRLADLDGDRRTDVIMTTPAGLLLARNRDGVAFESAEMVGPIDPSQEVLFQDEGTMLCDLNGDRVQDVCRLRSGSLVFYLGRGHGRFEPAERGSGVPEFEQDEPFLLRDLNGDGWDDLVRVRAHGVSYALAEGEGRFGAVLDLDDVPERRGSTFVTFADMNGSGSTDIVWVDVTREAAGSWQYMELFPRGRSGLLVEIDSGLGKKQTIEYAPAASFGAPAGRMDAQAERLNAPMSVVATVTVDLGLGDPPLVTEYRYAGGAYDPLERAFAAFATVTAIAKGDDSTPTLVTERHFDTGLRFRPLRGALLVEELRTEEGAVFSRHTHHYERRNLETGLDGRAVEHAYRSALLGELSAGGASEDVVTLIETEQDELGNVVLEQDWGVIQGDDYLALGDEAITVRTFASEPDLWVLGRLASETLQSGTRQTISRTLRYYDGAPFEGLPLGEVTRGALTREEAWVGPGEEDFELVRATRYGDHGLPVETKDALGGGRFFTWDASGTSLIAEGVKLAPGDGPTELLLVEHATIDGRFGVPTQAIDHAGATTHYVFDAFGRLESVVREGDTFELPTTKYRYEVGAPLSRVVTESRVESGEGAVELREDVFDGLGRKRASFVLDAELWLMAGVQLYDARGRPRKTHLPRWVSENERRRPPLLEEREGHQVWRDALGREVRTESPEGLVTRTRYLPLSTWHWDGGQADPSSTYEHTPTITNVDGRGRTIAHVRVLGGAVVSARYAYDAAGRLLSKTDPEGHSQSFRYDGRGRKLEVNDPDQGRHRFAYDAVGRLTSHLYPDGGRSAFTYDLAGRPVSEDWDDDGTAEITRSYDVGGARHRGKLVRVTEPTGFVALSYDERGQIVQTHYRIEDEDYVVQSRFDASGREVQHVYPDGSRLDLLRNARGLLSGYGELVHIEYAAQGSETRRRFSTGAELTSDHDRDGRPVGFAFRDADGNTVEHVTWQYDGGGNLVHVQDERPGGSPGPDRSQTFAYDNLYRISSASGTWGSSEWSYSPSGNLTRRRSTIPELDAGPVRYDRIPHGPSALGARALTYDERGRLLSDGDRHYEWDAASRLKRVSTEEGSVESVYGADGVRRVRREVGPDGQVSTTHFIDAWTEAQDGELSRYVVHAGSRIVRLSGERRPEPAPGLLSRTSGGPSARRLPAPAWGVGPGAVLALLAAARRRRLAPSCGQQRRMLARWTVVALGILVGCGGESAGDRGERIGELAPGDRLLISDQVGSLMVETDERGAPERTLELDVYGLVRAGVSQETNQFAGTPRDRGANLQHMGARFYAPDLGVWTSGDPACLAEPELQITSEFGAAHPYAYANLRPTSAVDRDGHYWQVLVGASVFAGGEAIRQYVEHGRVQDWGRVGALAVVGSLAGSVAWASPAVATEMLISGASGAAAGALRRLVESNGRTAGTWETAATDFAIGATIKGLTTGLQAVAKAVPTRQIGASRAAASPASGASPAGTTSAAGPALDAKVSPVVIGLQTAAAGRAFDAPAGGAPTGSSSGPPTWMRGVEPGGSSSSSTSPAPVATGAVEFVLQPDGGFSMQVR